LSATAPPGPASGVVGKLAAVGSRVLAVAAPGRSAATIAMLGIRTILLRVVVPVLVLAVLGAGIGEASDAVHPERPSVWLGADFLASRGVAESTSHVDQEAADSLTDHAVRCHRRARGGTAAAGQPGQVRPVSGGELGIEGLSVHDCISCQFDVFADVIVTSFGTPVKHMVGVNLLLGAVSLSRVVRHFRHQPRRLEELDVLRGGWQAVSEHVSGCSLPAARMPSVRTDAR